MHYQIHKNEKKYLALMMAVSGFFYAFIGYKIYYAIATAQWIGLLSFMPTLMVMFVLITFSFIAQMALIGYLKGNAIRVSEKQFPDIFEIITLYSAKLGLKTTPAMYVMQSGGLLNAFATRLGGRNYVVIYSDVLNAAYQKGMSTVSFIIGHELGHIKRKHVGMLKLLLFPANFIPFLSSAYSRACEYTCDQIGFALCPEGAINGLMLLAAGPHLLAKVDVKEYCQSAEQEHGFVMSFAEIISTHPPLSKRIAVFESALKLDEHTIMPATKQDQKQQNVSV